MSSSPAGQVPRTKPRLLAQFLIWGGVLLLLGGAFLAYPYLRSRLAARPAPAVLPLPAVASDSPAAAPTLTLTSAALGSASVFSFIVPYPLPTATHPTTPSAQRVMTPVIPTRISIPTIHVDAPVVATAWHTTEVGGEVQITWDVPKTEAAGWHETSAPLGVPGNTVLNGHNTGHGEVFRDLYTLKPGAPVVLYAGETAYAYVVSETLILHEAGQPLEVRYRNARYILPTADERITLITCHPYGSLRDRLIVIAYPEAVWAEASALGKNSELEER